MGKVIKLEAFEPYRNVDPEKFDLSSIPYYEKGKPPRHDLWHKLSFTDELERLYGKNWGAQGIGKLREVLLCRPTEDEVHPVFAKDPRYYMFYEDVPNVEKMQQQHDKLAEAYKDAGVDVHYMEYPAKYGPYGPIKWHIYTAREFLVIRGGAIIPRASYGPFIKGREIYMQKALTELGIPVLYTVHGTGICEIGASLFICENLFFIGRSIAYNWEGINQVTPVMERAGIQVVVNHIPGPLYSLEWPLGGTYHPDMFIGPVDSGVVVIYPALCGYETVEWLRDQKFKMIEIPPEEQRFYGASNLMPVEPGKVIMPAGPTQTIRAVEKEGVDVITVQYDEIWKSGGGIRCSTGDLLRDKGPGLEEVKR
ncbi:MAG: dimethylarginine dimethylaminohydrolase family protein [Candidatus Bathyarchaeia archaeon]